ncbi:hypothetical protein BDM02DRAFT_2747898 [Thelephora ganbajun]|uniref:Uncharacterized protein n=1 Tax=Thelephora ganbajun TaxID=370292 RepID=A0ACB6YX60_THEGA|nr:hypothetical protein BDM02DRAFT_2747898 [Thelephora ganbajun]
MDLEAVGKYSEIAEVVRSAPVLKVRPKSVDETSLVRSARKCVEIRRATTYHPFFSALVCSYGLAQWST